MIPVVWVSRHKPEIIGRGYWDQSWLEELLQGDLWPVPKLPSFEHHENFDQMEGRGGIVVVPARHHAEDIDWLIEQLKRMTWVLLILTGDEEGVFPLEAIKHPRMKTWAQTPYPDSSADRFVGDFWQPGTREHLADFGWPDLNALNHPDKIRDWFFAGQINNSHREAMAERLKRMQGGKFIATPGFTLGVDQRSYLSGLFNSKIALCPTGIFSVDTFRLFEALEAGCVPIVDAGSPAHGEYGYWKLLFGERPPFPQISSWRTLADHMAAELADWPHNINRIQAWWMEYKRSLVYAFLEDLEELGATLGEPSHPSQEITVIIPTSPVPSNPSEEHLAETIGSIRSRLPHSEIILLFDGVRADLAHRREAYAEFTRRVLWRANHEWCNVLPLLFEEHRHQAAMAREAMDCVRTKHILFAEHDTPLVGHIPWADLLSVLKSGEANVIRFHHEAVIQPEHGHLMLDANPQIVEGVPLLRTAQWSQRPHLARSDFYRMMLNAFFGRGARTFIEDAMHGVVANHWLDDGQAGWQRFRLWMYAPDDLKRSTHLDARGEDPKAECRFDYDGSPTPPGAPNPN